MNLEYEEGQKKREIFEEELKEIRDMGFNSYLDLETLKRNTRGDNTEYFYKNIYKLVKANNITDKQKIFRLIEIVTDSFRYQTWDISEKKWRKLIFEKGFPKKIPKKLKAKNHNERVTEEWENYYRTSIKNRLKNGNI